MRFINKNTELAQDLRQLEKDFCSKQKNGGKGTWKLHILASMVILSFVVLVILPYATGSTTFYYVCSGLLAVNLALIGFIIGHSACHGSFHKDKQVNEMMSYGFDLFAGVSSLLWKVKHNIAHHTYTNIDKHDDDTETGNVLRFSPDQKWRPWHLLNFILWIPAYITLYFLWVWVKDFQKLFSGKVAETKIGKVEFADILIILLSKAIHALLFIVLPWQVFGFVAMLKGYMLMVSITGLIIAIVFQIAHVQTKSVFPQKDEAGNMPIDWRIVQIISTANFGQTNFLTRILTGWLSHQVEHHLFPLVSPEYYQDLSYGVKKICEKHKLPYHSFPTFFHGFGNHIVHMWQMSFPPKKL